MGNYDWTATFQAIYDRAAASYRSGKRTAPALFAPDEIKFLATIGCTSRELFDFVEDFVRGGEPDFATVLLVTSARRDYFLTIQHGKPPERMIELKALPPKQDALDGMAWLPRIIEKARAKLRGEMPPELMYLCSGDRQFLKSVNAHPADFLRMVWAAGEDKQKIVDYVKASSGKR